MMPLARRMFWPCSPSSRSSQAVNLVPSSGRSSDREMPFMSSWVRVAPRPMRMGAIVVIMPVVVVMMVVIVAAMLVVHMAVGPVRRVHEVRLDLQNPLQIEGVQAQHLVQRHVRPFGPHDGRQRIQRPQPRLDRLQFVRRGQIDLVQDDAVSEGHLFARLFGVVQSRHHVFGVDQGRDAVQLGLGLDVLVDERRSGPPDRGRPRPVVSTMMASKAGLPGRWRFIRPATTRIRSPRTVQQTQPLFISNTSSSAPTSQVVVDADLAELVDDDGVAFAGVLGQDAVQQRRLARAEIAGQDGDGDLAIGGGGPRVGAARVSVIGR